MVDATYTRETLSSFADFEFTIYKRPEVAVSVTRQDGSDSSTSGELDVRPDSDVVLTFDRAVSVSELESWFTVSCDDEVIDGLTATPLDDVKYTIGAPSYGYALGSVCVLNIVALRVADSTYTRETLSSYEDFEFTIKDVFEDRFEDGDVSDWRLERLSVEFRSGSLYIEGTGIEFGNGQAQAGWMRQTVSRSGSVR